MELNTELFEAICKTPGAPGYESTIRSLIIKEIEGLTDEIKLDNLGNIYAIKKGNTNKKIMVAAHMDEIGFIVTHIDEQGFVRFHTLGGFDPKTLTAQKVIIHGKQDIIGVMGAKPIHVMSQEEKNKLPKTTDYFIDLGLPKVEVEKLVEIGNPITRYAEFLEIGDCYCSKSIDNRVSVFILIEALKMLKGKNIPFDLYAVFTVQEEVGIRGANVSSLEIEPDFGIGLDTTIAYDLPGAQAHEMVTKLGYGTGIKIMDSSAICDYRMVAFMKQVAKENKIKWQAEILTAGGTDTAGIQRMNKGGAITGAISIPTRHLHQVIEMAHKDDIESSINLLVKCISEMENFYWSH